MKPWSLLHCWWSTLFLLPLALGAANNGLVSRDIPSQAYSTAMLVKDSSLDDPSVESFFIPGAKVFDRYFDCPLDYSDVSGSHNITVFARHLVPPGKESEIKTLPFLIYLQGGPGFEVALPSSSSGWIKAAFDNGYQVLLLDQRGTGLSTAISAESLEFLKTDEAKAAYLTHFRADSIVRDCETIRKKLTAGRPSDSESRVALLGQSFGGFCITTYLSLFPESVEQAFITGGVPPLVDSPEPVYRALYPRVLKRNKLYYSKFPNDVERVRAIHAYLSNNKVTLPNGGTLSPRRFLQLGIQFGFSGGYDTVHQLVNYAANDLAQQGKISFKTLSNIQALYDWDTNVIYAILHEAIYCQGKQSNWAAERVLNEEPFATEFEWRLDHLKPDQAVYFTGEMIYPFMLDDYVELQPLKNVANLLAEYKGWGQLYDEKVLAKNEVPVAGVSYFDDIYVDREFSEETASKIKGFQQYITNEFGHK
ncbi:Alpha/Beta hydrolase protein [Zychaea mexicana]|uniref:Alpha/Beta hydrolase protein n=1 Tax=Zychaea mexicana TaxID=64656 RepID=UPI0022FE90CE|nr:Alpha/Beta hydrolase protein [Zychaea mexicana]KAI9489978.1 Alpha/Beta hydrolase protein [Zychaea mexicana]